ncbi:FecR domain-containing protein [Cytophagaceae bacterium DM2B3-1]|uniref:FecR domain-containing protein n=1 Tax=Xanthocytophaga flava TaxID=3048013 RepID=A0ABT7CJL6_9BACT|nr:FecR domain-containing protein [Xanthocytophaga flavus]MDJ1467856.1 FecR domain-containing protein [Xanthocytophaga flavus]MDJ1493934.1 FecR domain-containing protein [Xanthocytophaga flavus]
MPKPYSNYTLEDLIDNQSFRKWVKDPDSDQSDFWQEWLYQYPEKADLVAQARLILTNMDEDIEDDDIIDVWDRITKTNNDYEQELQQINTPVTNTFPIYFQWAAVILGVILTSALVWFGLQEEQISYTTHYGEMKTVILPDGSTVQLNSNSSIRYTKGWNSTQIREIWLEGEAFFSVTHTVTHQRFLVHTPQVIVEVLGTQFDVNTRRSTARIVLSEGKIQLNDIQKHHGSLEMVPGELVEVNKTIDTLIRRRVDPDNYTSWKQNKLIFEDMVLSEVATMLEDNYGFEFYFKDQEIANFTFTGSVSRDKVPLLFTILEKTFRIHINQNGNKVTVSK